VVKDKRTREKKKKREREREREKKRETGGKGAVGTHNATLGRVEEAEGDRVRRLLRGANNTCASKCKCRWYMQQPRLVSLDAHIGRGELDHLRLRVGDGVGVACAGH
jgi:hypothetical protein